MLGFAATAGNSVGTAFTNGVCTLQLFKSHRTPQKASILYRIPSVFCPNKVRLVKAMSAAETSAVTTSLKGKKQALISVSDKQDLSLLANGLQELGYTIVSTGGTATALEKAGVSVTKVEQVTCFPEMLDGRVKTLHPNVHGGILARRDKKNHMDALDKHGIGTFDLVVVNLYPFYEKVSSSSTIPFEDGIVNIDIGGPAMIRAAAKNHKDVLVVVDAEDYPALLDFSKGNQADTHFRRKLAWKAFEHVASYDSAVSEWLWHQTEGGNVTFIFRLLSENCSSKD